MRGILRPPPSSRTHGRSIMTRSAIITGFPISTPRSGARSNYWLNTLVLDREFAGERDRLLAALHAGGIRARPLWTPMHLLPMYRDCPRSRLPVAEDMHARCI